MITTWSENLQRLIQNQVAEALKNALGDELSLRATNAIDLMAKAS